MDVRAFIERQRTGEYVALDDKQADALLAFIESSDETDELRGRAAIAFGPTLDDADTHGIDDPDFVEISEDMFHRIQRTFQKLHMDADVPKLVRRRILEASVRAPQDWHEGAIRVAYSGDDPEWKLTAVFCMGFVKGFDEEIVESLDSADPDVHRHAVEAAGRWGIDVAWPHVSELAASHRTEKGLRLAAIEAIVSIRPKEALDILTDIADTGDEDITEAVQEALLFAGMDDLWADDDDGDNAFEAEDFEEDDEFTR